MKKFNNGDIIYNSIKTYPKVRFVVNSGLLTYNNNSDTDGNAVLFDFLRIPQETTPIEECFLLSEDNQILVDEFEQPLEPEFCAVTVNCAILTEESDIIYTETEGYLMTEEC